MKRGITIVIILIALVTALTGCASSKKNKSELLGLMILDNKQLGRNMAYYSKLNKKVRRDAHRKYKKYRNFKMHYKITKTK